MRAQCLLIILVSGFQFLNGVQGQDVFHITCENGEIRATGPIAAVHAECSKGLDAKQEANMCEFQCIRKKEGLLDDNGLPSLPKHIDYINKIMTSGLAVKAAAEVTKCFQNHVAAVQHHEKDNNCESSKDFNTCIKSQMLEICVPK